MGSCDGNLRVSAQEEERWSALRASDDLKLPNNVIEYSMPAQTQKLQDIEIACEKRDVASLAALARTLNGFVTDQLRMKAWPILLGAADTTAFERTRPLVELSTLPPHPEEDQVQLDVDRSFVYYPKVQNEFELRFRRQELFEVIAPTLRRFPKLCYFQGFHDIAQVLLLVLGKKGASRAVPFLSLLRIRDFMLPSLSPSLAHLKLLPAIIFAADPSLYQHLSEVRPFFALAATLTLYAHEVEDYGQIARLYDFLLAHEAAVSLYLFAVIILSRKEELLEIPVEDSDVLNFVLSKLPKSLDLEQLIADTMDLFVRHPPQKLPFHAWRKISASSVLKTTQQTFSLSNNPGVICNDLGLAECESLFAKQLRDLERQERRDKLFRQLWNHRAPILGLGTAIFVGLLSVWIQRNGLLTSPWIL